MLSKGAALLFVVCSVIPLVVAAAVSPAAACRSSFYPKLCVAMLSPLRSRTSSQYEYGKYSVRQALRQVRRTSALLDGYLAGRLGGARAHRGVGGGGALGDCRELAGLSAEYLAEAQAELGRRAARPDAAAAGRVLALMSAVVTNQQTCYDGLLASRDGSFPELQGSLANGTQLYGVSLGLVNTALGRSSAAGNAGPSSSGGQTSPPPVASPSTSGRSLVEELSQMVPVKLSQSGLRVAQDGTGDFTSISDAVAFAPNDTAAATAGYFVVYISEGIYHENVVVPMNKRNLILIGAGINRTVITSNHSVGDGWTTFNSATFAVNGERFIAVGITFENTAGAAKYQAVAVRNSADLTIFYRCSFLGYQDTLYVHTLRQFYRDCDVYGTVDFIFGNAAAVFQNCNLYARVPLPGQSNVVTAQGRTMPEQATGISIHNCTVSAVPELGRAAKTFLGRPWKAYSRTVFMQSFIDSAVDPAGWLEWNGALAPSTIYYGEFQNYGTGADTAGRVKWPGFSLMNSDDAFNFTLFNFTATDAWLSSTRIPYNSGLL
ncbi:pectinesterase-like [Zingiber officinale]|uniref:pectinesterase-like n=1 Tax=Zingiber officinale TaxID=94328 RepID=UPI001C4CAD14|nr:pectinesterase-like [Zingiber officinale]